MPQNTALCGNELSYFWKTFDKKEFWKRLLLLTCPINSMTKLLTQPDLKTFADHKLNMAHVTKFVFQTVENIVGKGRNASFSFSHSVFYPFE